MKTVLTRAFAIIALIIVAVGLTACGSGTKQEHHAARYKVGDISCSVQTDGDISLTELNDDDPEHSEGEMDLRMQEKNGKSYVGGFVTIDKDELKQLFDSDEKWRMEQIDKYTTDAFKTTITWIDGGEYMIYYFKVPETDDVWFRIMCEDADAAVDMTAFIPDKIEIKNLDKDVAIALNDAAKEDISNTSDGKAQGDPATIKELEAAFDEWTVDYKEVDNRKAYDVYNINDSSFSVTLSVEGDRVNGVLYQYTNIDGGKDLQKDPKAVMALVNKRIADANKRLSAVKTVKGLNAVTLKEIPEELAKKAIEENPSELVSYDKEDSKSGEKYSLSYCADEESIFVFFEAMQL